jgi:DNA polymerase-3 subunit beta
MELKIGVQDLAQALGRSQGIVEKKSTMPILSHVLLEARKAGQLVVSATDLDLAVSSEHSCEVVKEGSLAVSARHLYDIVRALPETTVSLKRAQNNYLELRSGSAEFRIVGLPAEDFPALPRFDKVPFADI